jgi:hypothetical protein
MRIPKPGVEPVMPRDRKLTDVWQDIICDKCGKSCLDKEGMNFEYATVEAYWGYGSDKDLYHDEAQVCEQCYDALGIKPQRTTYM